MQKKIFRFFTFAVMIAVFLAVLKLLNWLPMAVQGEGMRKYPSIEEVKLKLNIRDIYIPAYFPQSFTWPPSGIFAQKRPFPAIIMEFRHRERGEVALVISQAGADRFTPDTKIKLVRVRETIPYNLKGKDAVLEIGACSGGEFCSRISWAEGRQNMNIIAKYTPIELVRIAESMTH